MQLSARYRFPPASSLPTMTWALVLAILLAAPVYCEARESQQPGDTVPGPGISKSENPSPPGTPGPTRAIIGASDSIRITVFQNPELTTETRVSEAGSIVFPLIGEVEVAGLTTIEAGGRIADRLKKGQYIINPQISVALVQVRSRQVTVLA